MKSTFFIFRPEISFLGKFGPKTQNREFRLKLGTGAVPNMLNSMVKLIFFFFRPETLLLGRFGPKNSNCLFKVERLNKITALFLTNNSRNRINNW